MRALVSILLVFSFMSVSALVGYDRTDAAVIAYNGQGFGELVQQPADRQAIADDLQSTVADNTGDECPCSKKSDSLTLTCGVTLALSGVDGGDCLPGVTKAWFAFEHADRKSGMMYLLQRPPRQRL